MRWHLTGRTLGLVGYGRIARHVETMVSGFRMNVIHFDPFSKDSVPLDELLANSDFVSLHCPLTENTRHMIGMRELKLMKRNAVLVNTSRGAVVNEKALIEALKNGIIGGAALDVTGSGAAGEGQSAVPDGQRHCHPPHCGVLRRFREELLAVFRGKTQNLKRKIQMTESRTI